MMQELSDLELIRAYADSADELACAELMRRHHKMVFRACFRRLGNAHDAENATQATFLVMVQKAGGFRSERDLSGWLYAVARNVSLQSLRQRTRLAREKEAAVEMLSSIATDSGDDASCKSELLGQLDEAVAALPGPMRQAIVLRYFEGLAHEDAARIAGCGLLSFRQRASRGVERLRQLLEKRGMSLGGAALAGLLESEARAEVPEKLFDSTLAAVRHARTGGAGGQVVSKEVSTLTEGTLKMMVWTQVKTAALWVACVFILCGGALMTTHSKAGEAGGQSPAAGLTADGAGTLTCAVHFTVKPAVTKAGDLVKINFSLSGPSDVEVTVLGADGNAVRHLAAGVLGAGNPPPEPLKAGLVQELVWDGKDDSGNAVSGKDFKVRVRAGTGVKFGRFIGGSPYLMGAINSIACDDEGTLYVMGTDVNPIASGADCLRAFKSDGKYLRTIIPFPADLPPDSTPGVARWDAVSGCFRPRQRCDQLPAFYPWFGGARVISASKKGGVVLTSGTRVFRLDWNGGNMKGPFPMWPKGQGLNNPGWNIPQLAVSPDGRYIYYSNVANTRYEANIHPSKLDPKWPQGRVYRQDTTKPGSDPEKFYDLELPDYDKQKYWLPDAWNKRTAAYGISLDAKGNLYICDLVNQGIVEVDPDGKKVSFTKVPWPERVSVDARSGDYYVVSRLAQPKDGYVDKRLLKVSGRGESAKIAISLPLKGGLGDSFALGSANGSPVIWLGGGGTILCVRDAGTAFEPVETSFRPEPGSQTGFARIVSDYGRDEIYTNDGVSGLWRYDGRTGAGGQLKRNGQPFSGVDIAVSYDGLLYVRTGTSYSGPLERFDRDLKPAPFPSGTHVLAPYIYSRLGVGFCEKGLGVGPRGECYVSFMYDWNAYFVAGFGPDGKALPARYLKGKAPTRSKDPKEKGKFPPELDGAVIGPIPAVNGGIRVDPAGNIYLGMRIVPKGSPGAGSMGSVFKFPVTGGTVLGAVKADDEVNAEGNRIASDTGLTVVGATAVYPGITPFSNSGASCCVCRQPRFDVDRFGRVIMPDAFGNSVSMVDNAGNRILAFGSYGNYDSQFVNPETEEGKTGKPTVAGPEFPLAWPIGAAITRNAIYTIDLYNRRVLRADLTWQLEETSDVK